MVEKKKKFKYKPLSLKDILREMKQSIDLMIDLAYSALKFGSKELASISKLPSRPVLLGMAVNCIASPLTSFANGLNQIILKFVWAIEEIRKKKEQSGQGK